MKRALSIIAAFILTTGVTMMTKSRHARLGK